MRKKKSTVRKFGFFTDTHFTKKMKSRKDDYLTALHSKLRESFDWFEKERCEFVLFGGDFFDRHHELNWELMSDARELICGLKIPIYYIAGNHDELGYRVDSVHKSNLGFLDKISDGRLRYIDRSVDFDWLTVHACHAGEKVVDVSDAIPPSDKPSVLLAHCLLSNDNNKGNISLNVIKNTNISLVLSGDLHDGYAFQQNSHGIYCYNPGSLLRKSINDKARLPKVSCVHFADWFGKLVPVIEEFIPTHLEGDDIFESRVVPIVLPVNEDPSTNNDYVELFKSFKRESKDIFEILKRIGKEKCISDEVINLISNYQK